MPERTASPRRSVDPHRAVLRHRCDPLVGEHRRRSDTDTDALLSIERCPQPSLGPLPPDDVSNVLRNSSSDSMYTTR